ncbi:MAG: 50S ribosomal protein L25 [Actinobacteria bacterium]|nr:50S ribosomal protein L25 [Actinomycetota bacterium]
MPLATNPRTDFGKGAARRLRREGLTPAVIYGHGQAAVHVSIDSHELTLTLRKRASSIEISVDGKTQIVTPRDIQIDPVRRHVEHVDLVVVTAAEAATIEREATAASAAAEASAIAAAESAAAKAATRAARQEEAGATGDDNSAATEGADESAQ